MKCEFCGYIGSEIGCENPACDHAHWHTAKTLAAKQEQEKIRADFEASINRIDYSLSFKRS